MPTVNVRKWLETKSKPANELEQKAITLEVKASDEETNVIEGFASTFMGEPDSYDDVVVPGAFKETIAKRGNQIKLLFNHNWNKIIGRVTHLEERAEGLYFKAKISDTTLGNDVYKMILDKTLDRLSIGYRTIKSTYDSDTGVRSLITVDLFEVSVVGIPANDRAIITNVKNDEPETLEAKAGRVLSKNTEAALREAAEALEAAGKAMAAAQKEVADVLALVDKPEKDEDEEEAKKRQADEEAKQQAAQEEAERKAREAETERKARIAKMMETFVQNLDSK